MKKALKEQRIIINYISKINKEKIRLFGGIFFNENNKKCKLLINKEEKDLIEFYHFKDKQTELKVELIIKEKLKNMNGMFYSCKRLKSISNFSNIDTSLVADISYLFYECSSLTSISDFWGWNTSKVKDMKYLFYKCNSLKNMPGISKWDTSSVTDMSYMFYECSSLTALSEISNWQTDNVNNMDSIFYGCSNLEYPPDISKWKLSPKINKEKMFFGYDISKINIFEIINKKYEEGNNINENENESNKKKEDDNKLNINEKKENEVPEYEIEDNEEIYFGNPFHEDKEEFKILRNEGLKFLPQLEIRFDGEYEITQKKIDDFKNELKNIIGNDDFSIIEINKGSLKVIITLQYIYKKILRSLRENPAIQNIQQFPEDISKEINELLDKIMNSKFLFIGGKTADFVHESVFDITIKRNQNKIKRLYRALNDDKTPKKFNIYEQAKNITFDELEKLINNLSDEALKQELNQYNKNFDNFYETEKEIEKALIDAVFEYKIINIYLIIRDKTEYEKNKNLCNNRETKLLFHGTQPEIMPLILANNFKCHSDDHLFGQGTYFTDGFDYVTFYARNEKRNKDNFTIIPKVNETFSFISSQVYYDKNKKEEVYDVKKKNSKIEKNGMRCAYVDGNTKLLNREEFKDKSKFIANEFIISFKEQILPMYAISIKRCEYLIIWRDYNFDENNPNKYEKNVFKKMLEFNEEIKKFSAREFDSKVYYVKTSEEGINLIKRKKYNKIILISNGNNKAKEYITEARKIIGCDCISLVSAYYPANHLKWISEMKNILISNKKEFHERFIRNIASHDLQGINKLKKDVEQFYSQNNSDFQLNNFDSILPKYPYFKNEGKFIDLKF